MTIIKNRPITWENNGAVIEGTGYGERKWENNAIIFGFKTIKIPAKL